MFVLMEVEADCVSLAVGFRAILDYFKLKFPAKFFLRLDEALISWQIASSFDTSLIWNFPPN